MITSCSFMHVDHKGIEVPLVKPANPLAWVWTVRFPGGREQRRRGNRKKLGTLILYQDCPVPGRLASLQCPETVPARPSAGAAFWKQSAHQAIDDADRRVAEAYREHQAYENLVGIGSRVGPRHHRLAASSCRTPLNFVAALIFFATFFTAMNSPLFLLRLVQAVAPPSVVFN